MPSNEMSEQRFPQPTVGVLIFNPKDELLLVKSHKWRDKYVLPGGKIELGEKIEDAVKREAQEETGLDIYDIEFVAFREFIFGDEFWKKKHFIFLDYACKTNSAAVTLNSEAQDYIWIPLKKVSELPVEPKYTGWAIKEFQKKRLVGRGPID